MWFPCYFYGTVPFGLQESTAKGFISQRGSGSLKAMFGAGPRVSYGKTNPNLGESADHDWLGRSVDVPFDLRGSVLEDWAVADSGVIHQLRAEIHTIRDLGVSELEKTRPRKIWQASMT